MAAPASAPAQTTGGEKNIFMSAGTPKQTVLPLPVPPVPTKPTNYNIKITQEDIRKFNEDGVVVIRNAIPKEWIEFLRALVENAMATCKQAALPFEYTPAGNPGRFYGELDVWRRMQLVREWIEKGPAGEVAGRLMEAEYSAFLYDQLLVKEPQTAEATPWHQDRPYWAVRGDHVSSLWIPLDPIDKATCVEYIKGSHRWPQQFSPQRFGTGALYNGTGLPQLPDIEKGRAEGKFEFLTWDMQPGDVLVFNALTVHGSKGNLRSEHRRRAWAFRFVGDKHEFVSQPGREWGWPLVNLWDQGLKDGDSLAGHPDHPVVWRKDSKAKI